MLGNPKRFATPTLRAQQAIAFCPASLPRCHAHHPSFGGKSIMAAVRDAGGSTVLSMLQQRQGSTGPAPAESQAGRPGTGAPALAQAQSHLHMQGWVGSTHHFPHITMHVPPFPLPVQPRAKPGSLWTTNRLKLL